MFRVVFLFLVLAAAALFGVVSHVVISFRPVSWFYLSCSGVVAEDRLI